MIWDNCSLLHSAICYNRIEIAAVLIRNGAQINAKNINNETPLHFAISKPNFINLLLENGADIDASDILGNKPLHFAVFND